MKGTSRLIVGSISAAALVLLGVDKLGGLPVVDGFPVGLEQQPTSNPSQIVARITAKDLSVLFCVKLHGSTTKLTATIPKLKTDLQIVPDVRPQWFEISAAKEGQRKFLWPSGDRLVVASEGGATLVLEDWEIFSETEDKDSQSLAARRRQWRWASVILLGLALTGAAFSVWPQPASETVTAANCVRGLITQVVVGDAEQTRWMQAVLRNVLLEGTNAKTALEALPTSLTTLQKQQIWFKARGQFQEKMKFLIGELSRHYATVRQ